MEDAVHVSVTGVSVLASASCRDILLCYLNQSHPAEALSVLQQLSGLQGPTGRDAASLYFSPGSEGGARLCANQSARYGLTSWRLL